MAETNLGVCPLCRRICPVENGWGDYRRFVCDCDDGIILTRVASQTAEIAEKTKKRKVKK